jgi:hypothetical protein
LIAVMMKTIIGVIIMITTTMMMMILNLFLRSQDVKVFVGKLIVRN